jgi:hypothetical protein
MKKFKHILLLLTLLSSCTEWLDLRPESEIVLEDYWQTEAQANSVLSAAYRALTLDHAIERMLVWGELRSDNLVEGNGTNIDMIRILNVNITPTNSYADWGVFYEIINYSNTFLHYAPLVVDRDQNFTESKLRQMEAEALAIRAFAYFYLVRAFREVPLILEPSIDDLQDYNVGKATERELMDQIIKDLLRSKQSIRADYGRGAYNKGRFTRNAVNALLADVYLWDHQYANCVDATNELLNDKSLELVDGNRIINEVFYQGNSRESIFELQFDKDIQHNNTVNRFYGYSGMPSGHLSFPLYLTSKGNFSPFNYAASVIKESTEDLRENHFYGTAVNGTGYTIYKYALIQVIENADGTFTPRYRTSAATTNWIIYRLSDVMLMKAEALTQLNRNADDLREALQLVNTTYLRSNQTVDSLVFTTYSDPNDMEQLILRERQRELMFEGKRWFDLLRVVRRRGDPSSILRYLSPKLSGDNMQLKKLSVMDALYMPVLKSELEINPLLKQNPFYEDETFFNN